MTRDEFIGKLHAKGFLCIGTVLAKWQAPWVSTRDARTLVTLIRTEAVDLRLTGLSIGEMANLQGLMSADFALQVSVEFARDLVHRVQTYSGAVTAHSQNAPQFLS